MPAVRFVTLSTCLHPEFHISYLSSLVPAMAKALGVTIEEILGLEPSGQKKRGPQSQLERQFAAIASLPRKEQQQLLAVVDAFITQHATR